MSMMHTQHGGDLAQDVHLEDWLGVIRSEYLEMPGLRLTLAQSQHLWELDQARAAALLGVLVEREFLTRDATGIYAVSEAVALEAGQ